jgi:hypothetical protein
VEFSMRKAFLAATVLAVFGSGPALAIPGGSYAASCHEIHMEGPYLTALCGTGNGNLRWSRIFAPRCGGTGVSNQHGHLVCGGYYR